MSLLGYPKVIPYTNLNTLGSFVFELAYAPDKQTDRKTDGLEHPITPTLLISIIVDL